MSSAAVGLLQEKYYRNAPSAQEDEEAEHTLFAFHPSPWPTIGPLLQELDHHADILIRSVSSSGDTIRNIRCKPHSDALLNERRALELIQGLPHILCPHFQTHEKKNVYEVLEKSF